MFGIHKRKKNILSMIIFIVFVSTSFTFMSVVRADYRTTVNEQTVAAAGTNGANFDTPARDPRIVVALIARYSLTLVGTIFLVYAVYAGFIIMTSVGEEDKINNGKSTLRTAIIGILVTLSAYSLTLIVTQILNVTDNPDDYGGAFIKVDGPGIENHDPMDPTNPTPFNNGDPYIIGQEPGTQIPSEILSR